MSKKNFAEKRAERLAKTDSASVTVSNTVAELERDLREFVEVTKGDGRPYYTISIALHADAKKYRYAPQSMSYEEISAVRGVRRVLYGEARRRLRSTCNLEPTAIIFATFKQSDSAEYAFQLLLAAWIDAWQTSNGKATELGPWFLSGGVPNLTVFTANLTAEERAVLRESDLLVTT